MIGKTEMYYIECDNCGDTYENYDGYTPMGHTEDDAKNIMGNQDEWITDHNSTPEKHYCPLCAKMDEDVDDKIIIDSSRTKLSHHPFPSP